MWNLFIRKTASCMQHKYKRLYMRFDMQVDKSEHGKLESSTFYIQTFYKLLFRNSEESSKREM